MKRIEKIVFYKEGRKKYSIISYTDKTSLKLSYKAGMYAVKQYMKENDILRYKTLLEKAPVELYNRGFRKTSYETVETDKLLKKIYDENKKNKYLGFEIDGMQFYKDKNDDERITITYNYLLENERKSSEQLEEDIAFDEGISELFEYATDNNIKELSKIFLDENFIISEEFEDVFYSRLLPQLQKAYDKYNTLENVVEDEEISDIKVGEETVEDEKYETVTTEDKEETVEDKNDETVLDEEEKEKAEETETIVDIQKIVLYTFVDENDENITNAVIFYNDGTVKNVSKDDASELLFDYAKRNNIKDYHDLFTGKFIEVVTGKELEESFQDYYKEANQKTTKRPLKIRKIEDTEDNSKEELNNEEDNDYYDLRENVDNANKNKSFFKKIKNVTSKIINKVRKSHFVRRIAVGIGALAFLVGGFKIARNVSEHKVDNIKSNEDNNTLEAGLEREDFSNCNYQLLLQKCTTNDTRKSAMSDMYKFLNNYNNGISDKYNVDNISTKIIHTVDEETAMYLAYNNFDAEAVYQIYGTTTFDKELLKTALENAIKQDSQAHNVQTSPLGKDILMKDENTSILYNKYEQIFINMNNTKDIQEKVNYMQEFYNNVRTDLPGINANNYNGVDQSKIIIKEFNDAMSKVNLECSNKLNENETNYVNGIVDNVIMPKYNDIVTKQNARSYAATVDYDGECELDNDLNPYYSDFKEKLETELIEKDAYYTNDNDRDISSYYSYRKNTNQKEIEKTETNDVVVPKENTDNKNISKPQEQPISAVVVEETPVETPTETPVSTESVAEENDSDDIINQTIIVENATESLPESTIVPEVEEPQESETPSIDEEQKENVVTSDAVVEEYKPEDIEEEIDIITDSAIEIDDNETDFDITIDSDKKDEFGNLNDQFSNITTSDAVTTTSTKSNEELVDEMIAQMEQQSALYDNENSKTLVK